MTVRHFKLTRQFGGRDGNFIDDGFKVHAASSQNAMMLARLNPRIFAGDGKKPSSQNVRMVKVPSKASANHLRAWREFNRMSQEDLAKLVGTAGNVIGLLESGERGLSDKWLRKLAPALGTTPGWLLDHHPEDVDREILEVFRDIDKADKPKVLRILQEFRRAV